VRARNREALRQVQGAIDQRLGLSIALQVTSGAVVRVPMSRRAFEVALRSDLSPA
jgi:hypothetical protein